MEQGAANSNSSELTLIKNSIFTRSTLLKERYHLVIARYDQQAVLVPISSEYGKNLITPPPLSGGLRYGAILYANVDEIKEEDIEKKELQLQYKEPNHLIDYFSWKKDNQQRIIINHCEGIESLLVISPDALETIVAIPLDEGSQTLDWMNPIVLNKKLHMNIAKRKAKEASPSFGYHPWSEFSVENSPRERRISDYLDFANPGNQNKKKKKKGKKKIIISVENARKFVGVFLTN